ncbi:hypothetical protein FRC14_004310 [Serendipita sp. 396]|nr:hypothetical protein FRC14_004310 [Serendipita sp. 396]
MSLNLNHHPSMAEDSKVRDALQSTLNEIGKGLDALQKDAARSGLTETIPLEILRKDFISVVSLIYNYSTRLWIAIGKQPPTPSAALPTLKDLSQHVSTLYGCALAFRDVHGKSFMSEARRSAVDILVALQPLLQEYMAGKSSDNTMRKTAAIHESCDKARNLSLDAREAVCKEWKVDNETLKDAMKEVNEMLNPERPGHDEEISDGWDELLDGEAAHEVELTEKDRAAIKKVTVVLERLVSYRKQIQKTVLSPAAQVEIDVTTYDQILELSREFIPIVDDIVGCLDLPVELDELKQLVEALGRSLRKLHNAIPRAPTNVSVQMDRLDLSDHSKPDQPLSGIDVLQSKLDDILASMQAI